MKIYLLGRGHRLQQIRDALGMHRTEVVATIHSEPDGTFPRPSPVLSHEDIIIVAEYEDAALRAVLDRLRAEKLPAKTMVFTSVPSRPLVRDYPEFLFRDEGLIYRNEIRELQRKAAGRQRVDALRAAVKGRPLLTVIWGNPDPDAIASAYALHELVREDAAPESQISYMGEFTRTENEAMARLLKIPMRRFSRGLLTSRTVTATVDAQPSFFAPESAPPFDIVIDHHPASQPGGRLYTDVRPTYGATSTLLTEYFQASGVRLTKKAATALFYGLKIDTGNLTRNVSDADVAAFRFLRMRIDENVVRTIELSQLPLETLDYFAIAFANKKIARDTAFAYLGTIPNPDMCVHVADFFIKLTGISWVVTACRSKERVVAVFRSDGLRKHAGKLAESLFAEYGTAGGHRTMARAELELGRLVAELRAPTDIAIEEWLLRRLSGRIKALGRFAEAQAAVSPRS
ncbi:MAG TPA: DHH family phosphoesterase [Planctomycetota bacterium]|nr:DHH family phosphoesterase [Planctomycetota bacterium]